MYIDDNIIWPILILSGLLWIDFFWRIFAPKKWQEKWKNEQETQEMQEKTNEDLAKYCQKFK